jgi:hypothetical protein
VEDGATDPVSRAGGLMIHGCMTDRRPYCLPAEARSDFPVPDGPWIMAPRTHRCLVSCGAARYCAIRVTSSLHCIPAPTTSPPTADIHASTLASSLLGQGGGQEE